MSDMKTIADKAGVSVATVSRALNNSNLVNEKTRNKILKIAQEIGYDISSNLKNNQLTNLISIITPSITNISYMEILEGISSSINFTEYNIVVYNIEQRKNLEKILNQNLKDKRIKGLIVFSMQLNEKLVDLIKYFKKPTVILDKKIEGLPSISIENQYGGYIATKHLIDLGHKHIACVHGKLEEEFNFDNYKKRLNGYLRALNEYNLPINKKYIKLVDNKRADTPPVMESLFGLKKPPTAIFATSDLRAFNIHLYFKSKSLRIPEDIALVGFDDLEFSKYIDLTTVRQPMKNMGKAGVRLIKDLIENESDMQNEYLYFKAELVIRNTCGYHLQTNN